MYMRHELCICVTTYVYASRTWCMCESQVMYMCHELCVSVCCICLCTWVTNYVYASRLMYMSHTLCICECFIGFVYIRSRTLYMRHDLCIWVPHYVYAHTLTSGVHESRTMYMRRAMYMRHDWCAWVTNYVCASRTMYMHHNVWFCESPGVGAWFQEYLIQEYLIQEYLISSSRTVEDKNIPNSDMGWLRLVDSLKIIGLICRI